MNLPLVLDVGIGLLFIYLTLSLLASELQELLTTILQWRAKHLRQAIETLLAGENKPEPDQASADIALVRVQIERAKALTANLYDHSLLRSLNQEAKGLIGRLGQIASRVTQTARFFAGKSSGPSYIPSGSFSTSLIETLKIQELIQKLSQTKLERFISQQLLVSLRGIVADLRNGKGDEALLENELQKLQMTLNGIMQRFNNRELTLPAGLSQSVNAVQRFLAEVDAVLPQDDPLSQIFLKRLVAVGKGLPALLEESGPSMMEVVAQFDQLRWVAQLLRQHGGDYRQVLAYLAEDSLRQRFQAGYQVLQSLCPAAERRDAYLAVLSQVSPYLQDNLYTLARRAQARAQAKIYDIEQDALQFQQEVALWFDRSMDRASGVYKRNAKGVAIVMGFLLAVSTNTDTLHMVNKLSKDATLRATYTQAASALASANPAAISCLETAADKTAQTLCLQNDTVRNSAASLRQAIDNAATVPIGWNPANWQEQWQPALQGSVLNGLKLFAGWLISAIAISMGAPFWFNLLNKVVNVRSSGKQPAPVVQDRTVDVD